MRRILRRHGRRQGYEFHALYVESERLYDIVFMANGTAFDSYKLAYGAVITAPEEEPDLSGYDFVGWYGYTPGMKVDGDETFTAMFEEVVMPFPPYFPDDDEWVPVYPGGSGSGDITDPNHQKTGGLTDKEMSALLMTLAIICVLLAIFLLILAKRRKDDEEDEQS